MELYFNELSIKMREKMEYTDIKIFSEVYKGLDLHDIKHCRIDDSSYEKMFHMMNQMPNSGNAINFFFSFFHRPFESDEVLEKEEEYYIHRWRYGNQDCMGLAISFLMDSISLGFNDAPWDKAFLQIMKDSESVEVRNISREGHISCHEQWIREKKDIVLKPRTQDVTEKDIILRDDHGKDILLEFGKKLIKNEYVLAVLNSLPYNPKRKRFIHAVKEDGLIEIVLPWTDQGLGLVVKTTGRNIRETEKIAEILKKKYGRL